jgi:hypothetical protein
METRRRRGQGPRLIALAWIPLSAAELPSGMSLPPTTIYHQKGYCAKKFDELMSNEVVSKVTGGDYTHELHNTAVHSALVMAVSSQSSPTRSTATFPTLTTTRREIRRGISVVKMGQGYADQADGALHRRASRLQLSGWLDHAAGLWPQGADGDRRERARAVEGKSDQISGGLPPAVVKKHGAILDAFRFDPQKIAKHEGSYELVLDAFETELLRRKVAA